MTRPFRCLVAATLFAVTVPPAPAQQARQPEAVEDDAPTEILVVARRSGTPIWEVRSGASTVLLVGEIDEVPKTSAWRPESLEDATRSADRVILGMATKATAGDLLRILFKGPSLTKLPDGRTADEYLDTHQMRRLHALEGRFRQDYARQSFLLTAHDILTKRLGLGQDTTGTATDVVRRAAKRARVRTQPVGTMRVKTVLDDLFSAPPEAHVPCLKAAFDAADAGPESVDRRGRAWSSSDIVDLMANPVEIAIGRCFPWSSDQIGQELRQQWRAAIDEALGSPGTTLAVVPIRILVENGGLLDSLQHRRADINGPAWRRAAS